MTQQRVRFGDIKPYAVPESLSQLRGPASGRVTLPMWVCWAPGDRTFDVETRVGAKQVYTAVLSEGVLDEVCEFVNAQRLVELWDVLLLPRRAVAQWEQAFPELARPRTMKQREQQRGLTDAPRRGWRPASSERGDGPTLWLSLA